MDNIWTPERIENYKNASEYTFFHRKLSVLAEPYLDENQTMADIGCGPALIDFWLAPMVSELTAIDSDPAAIDYLNTYLDAIFITNRGVADKIIPRLAGVDDLRDESWDIVLLSFFGLNEEYLEKLLPLARRRILIFMHGRPDTTGPIALASLDDGGKFAAPEMEAYLEKKGLAYRKKTMEMQFGQPFKSIEDIHAFLSSCGDSAYYGDSAGFEKSMADAEERIVKTGRFDYPYYLPKSISVAMFVISATREESV